MILSPSIPIDRIGADLISPVVLRNDLDIIFSLVPGLDIVLFPQVICEVYVDSGLVVAEVAGEVLAVVVVPQGVSLQVVGPGGLVVAVLAGDGMEDELVESPNLLNVQGELLGRLLVADVENISFIQKYLDSLSPSRHSIVGYFLHQFMILSFIFNWPHCPPLVPPDSPLFMCLHVSRKVPFLHIFTAN